RLFSEGFMNEECLNRLAKPNMNEDFRMNEPKNPEDRLAEEGGAQNSMFAALQQIWLGVSTFDALSRRDFDLHAALQEDTMLMQMMVNSLLGTFLALPGNMMEVPIFQMAILRGPVQYGWMYPGDISMVWYYVFPLFLLLALVILELQNEGGFPDVEKQNMFYISFNPLLLEVFLIVYKFDIDEIPNGVVQNVDIIDASVDGNMLVIMTREISQIQMGLKEIEVAGGWHSFIIICRGRDRSMGLNEEMKWCLRSGHVNEKYILMKNSPHFVKHIILINIIINLFRTL
ncbi:hypothetical protein ACJX0J_012934, partial [Zea mays]